jgi:hypothetical protein
VFYLHTYRVIIEIFVNVNTATILNAKQFLCINAIFVFIADENSGWTTLFLLGVVQKLDYVTL